MALLQSKGYLDGMEDAGPNSQLPSMTTHRFQISEQTTSLAQTESY